jgi:hypothetical protein
VTEAITQDVWDAPASRGVTRIAGILWLVAAFTVAVLRTSHTTQREIGSGVQASCHPTWTSQLPQLLVAVAGCALLLVAAEHHLLRPRVVLAATGLACAWGSVLALVPSAFDLRPSLRKLTGGRRAARCPNLYNMFTAMTNPTNVSSLS